MKIMITTVLVLAATLGLVACNGTNPKEAPSLENTTWMLASIEGQAVLEGSEITAVFNPTENRVSGVAGCNSYFAEYETNGNTVSISATGATRMLCAEPDGIMQQETAFLDTLTEVLTHKIEGSTLEMRNAAGERILQFVAKGES